MMKLNIHINIIPDLHVTEDEVIKCNKAINELSKTAAPGPDGIPAILLKQWKEKLSILFECSGDKAWKKIVQDKLKKMHNYTNLQSR